MPNQAELLIPYREISSYARPPVLVGVVTDSNPPPRWVDALFGFLKQTPLIEARLFTIAPRDQPAISRPAWLTDRLYSASRSRFDPFGCNAPFEANSVSPVSIVDIQAAGFGVIIWIADQPNPDVVIHSLAQHGVFTIRLGEESRAIPYWDEVAENRVTSTASIFWHDTSFAQGRLVREAETSTSQGLFVTTNSGQPLVALMRMLTSLCMEIQRDGAQFEERVRHLSIQLRARAEQLAYPSNFQAARFLVNKLARSAYRRYANRGKQGRWFVAMRPNRGGCVTDRSRVDLSGFAQVPLPNGVQEMADPFLWEARGRQYLLFEEVATGQSRGRLACVEVLQDGSCAEMEIILDRPYHLSYPCVVPSNGELFLVPESSAANRIDVYRFSRFPSELELVSSPIVGVGLVDTTPVYINGRWYIFTTTQEPFMESLLFSATRLDGPWEFHPCNPVSTSVRNCRSAGQIFWKDGRLFRPTQDCSVQYGYAVTINELTKLTPHEFEERPVSYLPPTWTPGLLGTHTWNESAALQVIDGMRLTQ